ncbi:hypothetical protein ACWCPF_10890, partial [Streptomyces sp. NPDC001858]
ATAPPRHRATAPPRHRATAPPRHRATAPPRHRATGPPGHRAATTPARRSNDPRPPLRRPLSAAAATTTARRAHRPLFPQQPTTARGRPRPPAAARPSRKGLAPATRRARKAWPPPLAEPEGPSPEEGTLLRAG